MATFTEKNAGFSILSSAKEQFGIQLKVMMDGGAVGIGVHMTNHEKNITHNLVGKYGVTEYLLAHIMYLSTTNKYKIVRQPW